MKVVAFCLSRGAMMERIKMVVAGFFIGGFLGWFMGIGWYEFIEVPEAASMNPMAAETCLCVAGAALPLLAIPGAILGAIVGALKNRPRAGKENRNQPAWFI